MLTVMALLIQEAAEVVMADQPFMLGVAMEVLAL
jgi:hypothetical protein